MKKIIGKLAAVLAVGLSLVFASCSTGVVDNGTAPEIKDAFFASQVHSDNTFESTKANYLTTTMNINNSDYYYLPFKLYDPDKDIQEIWLSRTSDFSGIYFYWNNIVQDREYSVILCSFRWSNIENRNEFVGTGPIYLKAKDAKGNVGTFTIPGITITNN